MGTQAPSNQVPLKVWLLGLLWAIISAMPPVGVLLIDWLQRWNDPPDPVMIWHLAATCAIGGAVAYWRKHKALLKLPPSVQAAWDLQASTNPPTTLSAAVEAQKQANAATAAEPSK